MSLPLSVSSLLQKDFLTDSFGAKVKVKAMSTKNNLLAIQGIFINEKPRNSLEIGFAFGASALCIQELHKDNSKETPLGYHTAIDPFQAQDWKGLGIKVLKENNCIENFTHIEEFSYLALPELLKNGKKFDFIYVDGSHVFENAFLDFYFSFLLLEVGGIILFDDCSDKEVKKVISYVRRNYRNYVEELDILNYFPRSSWQSIKYRIGRKLNIVQLVGFRKTRNKDMNMKNSFRNF